MPINEKLLTAVKSDDMTTTKKLISQGANINTIDTDGQTPLHHAAKSANLTLVQLLVRNGASIFHADASGDNAITIAKKNGYPEIASYLENKTIHRQQQSQKKFFDHHRSKKQTTTDLVTHYSEFRTDPAKKDTPIQANHIPGRRLIMGDSGAVAQALLLEGIPPLTTANLIAEHCGWHNSGFIQNGHSNANWSRESIHYKLDVDRGSRNKVAQELTISSQYHPQPGHIGNFFMAGIGRYGEAKDNILYVINETTRTEPANPITQASNEKKLAQLLLTYTKKGDPINNAALADAGFQPFSKKSDRVRQLSYLNRICYLAGIKEVTRRMHTGVRPNGTLVDELPIGVSYIMSLQLIIDGHLSMKQVFDQEAEYGLPTASGISTEREIAIAKQKLIRLTALFHKIYPSDQPVREWAHQLLLSGYGGDSDTSGDEYESSDDEPENDDITLVVPVMFRPI